MQNDTKFPIKFPSIKNKKIVANFQGGDITSNGGIMLLKKIDKKLKFTSSIAKFFPDDRNPYMIEHTILQMLRQRIYGIALGYEDLNDHDSLRKDIAFQAAIGKEDLLASSPTLCRFENKFRRETAVNIQKKMIEVFVESFKRAPEELILDFDSTDNPVHGNQEKKAYHGYYEKDCFLPLEVFCKDQLLVSYLRPSNEDGAKHSWAILALLVKHFRKIWPHVKITFRADSGFCRKKILDWCDKNQVNYIVGIGRNLRIEKIFSPHLKEARDRFNTEGEKQIIYRDFNYAPKTWKYERRLIGKAEINRHREDSRFVVTTLQDRPEEIYKNKYSPRGDMENRIKEQIMLFSDRTSAHLWWPNQLRLLLSSMAYILLERLRSGYLKSTKFANSQMNTIRLKILKIGAVIIKNTRKIMLYFSSSYPDQDLFMNLVENINSS